MQFTFSIVIAIYNTAQYLQEAIDSILTQTLDFQEHVQLILVNDGSEDNSLDIALEYQKKFPNNIIVLSQENQGQASARNNGLDYVKGKYVNFLDSDDILSENTLEEVKTFFEANEDSIDVVAIKLMEFERKVKQHPLNFKFSSDHVIDLLKYPKNPQLSVSSAFIKYSAINGQKFKTNLVSSEDSNFMNRILLNKKAYGVLKCPVYYYRKRVDSSSTIDSNLFKKEYFTDRLKYHFMDLIEYCLETEGKIPLFIKFTLAYNLQWMVTHEFPKFDSKKEELEFKHYFNKVLSYLSVEVLSSKSLIKNQILRNYLISEYNHDLHINFDSKNQQVFVKSKNKKFDRLGNHKLWIDVLEIKNNYLNISGSLNSMFNPKNVAIKAVRTDRDGNIEIYTGNQVDYTVRKDISYFSKKLQFKHNFDINVLLGNNGPYEIKIKVLYYKNGNKLQYSKSNTITNFLPIGFRKHAPLSKYCHYFVKDSKIVVFNDDKFEVSDYKYLKLLKLEYETSKKIFKDKSPNYFKALLIKGLFFLSYPFVSLIKRNKKIFIFMDRIDKADDNAEHLFRYASNQKDNVKKYYVISEDCDDYSRMKKEFKHVVSFSSLKHKLLFLFSDKIICSGPENKSVNPFFENNSDIKFFANTVSIPKYYIRHGVTQGHMSSWLRKFDKNLDLVLTSSNYEKESFLEPGYNYDEDRIQVLGLPRFDNLKRNRVKKQILIAPTWRNYLKGNKELFLHSDYFKSLNELLSDWEFAYIAEQYGYEIIFKAHPNLEATIGESDERFIDLFDINGKIKVVSNEPYQKLFNESAIMITDFSSVFFDFAYLKKPIIYYQPNDDHPFSGGYFNYDTMGFGKITRNLDDFKAKLRFYLERDCVIEKKYENRINNFFKYVDKNNCKRAYAWIKNY